MPLGEELLNGESDDGLVVALDSLNVASENRLYREGARAVLESLVELYDEVDELLLYIVPVDSRLVKGLHHFGLSSFALGQDHGGDDVAVGVAEGLEEFSLLLFVHRLFQDSSLLVHDDCVRGYQEIVIFSLEFLLQIESLVQASGETVLLWLLEVLLVQVFLEIAFGGLVLDQKVLYDFLSSHRLRAQNDSLVVQVLGYLLHLYL